MLFSAHRTLKIDKQLYERLSEVAQQAGYASTEELIVHVLEREVAHLQDELDRQHAEDQLRGLGYVE